MHHSRVAFQGERQIGVGVHPVVQQVLEHVGVAVHEDVVEDEAALGVSLSEHAVALTRPLNQVECLDHEREIAASRALEEALADLLLAVFAVWSQLLLLISLKKVEERVL